jgi:hypothetical protein
VPRWHTGAMASLRHRIVALGGAVAPSGRMTRLRLRVSADVLVTLALATAAVAASVAYQVLVRRSGRRPSSSP